MPETPPHHEPLKPYLDTSSESCARAYLLTGRSAAPFEHDVETIKYGYVRLSIWETTTPTGDFGIDLHFGKGTWEGGYIDFVADEVTELLNTLATIEEGTTSVTGQGRVIDGTSFDPDEEMQSKLHPDYAPEQTRDLHLEPLSPTDDAGVVFTLGEHDHAGVEVEATYAQRMDLLECISTLRDGTRADLPGDYSSYPRIGPSGEDTWDMGRDPELTD
jgi:hypothetical protein